MATFEEIGIESELLESINELGFENPMPIQEKVIPVLLKQKKDIIALAQTGTGKTAAFGLPLIQLIDLQYKRTQALILSPTRELCLQITNDLKNFAKHIRGLNVVAVYGGADIDRQVRAVNKGAHIIVATPGRMDDLLNKRKKIDISAIETVVLDEADEMLTMGFKDELDAILEQTPETKNTLLFSATMPPEIKRITKNYMTDPLEISVGERNVGAEHVDHICYQVHEKNRYLALKRIVDYFPNIYGIIFCRTREETKQVAKKLMHDGYNADALHGDLSQAQRESVMQKFRIKNLHLLTATDVAARGLDVKDLTHIINYNLPDEALIYIHRSGRTGRAGQRGISIIISNLREKLKISKIERLLRKKFAIHPVPTGRAICEKQLLNIVDRLEKIEVDHDEIDSFLPAVYEKLESLNKEELIKHFVALEFNHFLDYYKRADDLLTPKKSDEEKPKRSRKSERSDNRFESRSANRMGSRSRRSTVEEGFTRFYINLGEKDKIKPLDLIGLVNRSTRGSNVNIGKIDILRKFSFFEVDESYTDDVLNGFKNIKFNKTDVMVEISTGEGTNNSSSSPRSERRKRPKRKKGGWRR
ncbi:DEAD/DEAH box helicase [candidate division KSB1 bacterium]|nr:DEAD/DEAH box helicase [candidate division KSB1 bacterium]